MKIPLSLARAPACLALTALCLGLFAQASAAADSQGERSRSVIFSNLGPKGNLYSRLAGYGEDGQDTRYGAAATAFRFRVKEMSYMLTEVDIPLWVFRHLGTDDQFLFVVAEESDFAPGKAIYQQQITYRAKPAGCCRLAKVVVSPAIKLQKGQYYWLETLASDYTAGGWAQVYKHIKGRQSDSFDGGKTWTQGFPEIGGAFAVYGTPVGD